MICLVCGEPVAGPVVVRLRQGAIKLHKAYVEFVIDEFEDGNYVKWIHNTCAARNDIFPNLLNRRSCDLCGHQIEPLGTPLPNESVLHVERGVVGVTNKGPRVQVFEAQQGGCVHYICAVDKWRLNALMSLIAEAV